MFHNLHLRQLGLRNAHPPQHDLPFSFWQKRITQMFSKAIAARCTEENYLDIFKLHLAYCEKLYLALLAREEITTHDISDLLHDCNVGDGEWSEKLIAAIYKIKADREPVNTEKLDTSNAAATLRAFKTQKELEPLHRIRNFVRQDKGVTSYINISVTRYSPFNSSAMQTLSPNGIQAMLYAERGQWLELKNLFDSLGATKKKVCLSTEDSHTKCNLLHAAAASGSRECLDLIIDIAGDDIKMLYRKSLMYTPAYYACKSGSLYALQRTLALSSASNFPIHEEFSPPEGMEYLGCGFSAYDEVIYRQDLPALRILLEWLKENNALDEIAALYHPNHRSNRTRTTTLLTYLHSGAMFYLLNEYISFNKDDSLLATDNPVHDQSFSTSCLTHYKMIELKQAHSNTSNRRMS